MCCSKRSSTLVLSAAPPQAREQPAAEHCAPAQAEHAQAQRGHRVRPLAHCAKPPGPARVRLQAHPWKTKGSTSAG